MAVRAGAAGFGGAKERDQRLAERGGGVHRSGVVGDHQLAPPQPLDHFGQRSLAAQIQAACWGGARYDFAQRFVFRAAKNGEVPIWEIFREEADEFGKIFGRPAFIRPARAGLKGNPPRAIRWPFSFHFVGDCGLFGQPLEIFVNRHAQMRQHGQIPIHGVGVKRGAPDSHVIKSPRAFADFVEADEKFPVGEPGERAAAREALEVNHPVEILFAHPADAAKHFRPVPRLAPAPALKADDAGQIGVAFEEWREVGINPPENFTGGQVAFEQPEDGQGLDDIAERAGFEN